MQQNIVIISGGRQGDVNFFRKKLTHTDNRLLICCDGGARHLSEAGMMPDVLMGDMDSIEPAQLPDYERQGVKIIKHPADKDFTDTALALDYALSQQPQSIDIWGALGGRIDHALANIHLLIRSKSSGVKIRLLDEFCEMFVPDQETNFEGAAGCLVSLLALSPQVEGITLRGFTYPLIDGTLTLPESRGISNIISGGQASIRIRSGNLLVIRYWQKDTFPEVE